MVLFLIGYVLCGLAMVVIVNFVMEANHTATTCERDIQTALFWPVVLAGRWGSRSGGGSGD